MKKFGFFWDTHNSPFHSPLSSAHLPLVRQRLTHAEHSPSKMATTSLRVLPDLLLKSLSDQITQRSRQRGYKFFVQRYIHCISFNCPTDSEVVGKAKWSMKKNTRTHICISAFTDTYRYIPTLKSLTTRILFTFTSNFIYDTRAGLHQSTVELVRMTTKETKQRWSLVSDGFFSQIEYIYICKP